jgi:hypothetical protein
MTATGGLSQTRTDAATNATPIFFRTLSGFNRIQFHDFLALFSGSRGQLQAAISSM